MKKYSLFIVFAMAVLGFVATAETFGFSGGVTGSLW